MYEMEWGETERREEKEKDGSEGREKAVMEVRDHRISSFMQSITDKESRSHNHREIPPNHTPQRTCPVHRFATPETYFYC